MTQAETIEELQENLIEMKGQKQQSSDCVKP